MNRFIRFMMTESDVTNTELWVIVYVVLVGVVSSLLVTVAVYF
jgi:Flp pilus assembly pilin Flp